MEDILYETNNFYVKVGFAIYSQGQVMVIPKSHYSCFGEMPNALFSEFSELENLVANEITKKFSEPFQIEMGNWGQSVKHAHIHFIPMVSKDYKIKNIINEMVEIGKEKIQYESGIKLDRLREIYNEEGGYLSIKQNGILYACHIKGIEFDPKNPHPQLTLRTFFPRIGVKGVDSWREMSREDKIIDNKKRDLTKQLLKFH